MTTKRRPKAGTGSIDEWVTQQQGLHFCHCGCGQPIVIKRRHSEPGRGIPKFLRGHYIWSQDLFGKTGQSNPNWKGGQVRHSAGYIYAYAPDHPHATKEGYVLEHRLVLEQHLRQTDPASAYLTSVDGILRLRPDVIVHHVDHSKTNNDVANLQPLKQGEHAAMHNREKAAIRRSSL